MQNLITGFYIGFRIELPTRLMKARSLVTRYNKKHQTTQIFDLHKDGRITTEKSGVILLARGVENDKPKATGVANFSLLLSMNDQAEVERLAQIINVLGNDRLIREKISLFTSDKSLLNAFKEFDEFKAAFADLEKMLPGLIRSGYYYAPETIL